MSELVMKGYLKKSKREEKKKGGGEIKKELLKRDRKEQFLLKT